MTSIFMVTISGKIAKRRHHEMAGRMKWRKDMAGRQRYGEKKDMAGRFWRANPSQSVTLLSLLTSPPTAGRRYRIELSSWCRLDYDTITPIR